MTQQELDIVVAEHKKWLFSSGVAGKRANLEGANLEGANLQRANLQRAFLQRASLKHASLKHASLKHASLEGACLDGACLDGACLERTDLQHASLKHASLKHARLDGAYLVSAKLMRANLEGANLEGAYLKGVRLEGAILPQYQIVPSCGSFTAYKKVSDGAVLTLEVPANALRTSNLVGRKCRASAATVIASSDGGEGPWYSSYDTKFCYRLGETVTVPCYDDDIRIECAPGIHFFTTQKEAEGY